MAGAGWDPPSTATSFLGRAAEISEVVRELEGSRLVTLTGPPGIGKTRLALEVTGGLADGSPLVELAPIRDPALVPRALASALSVQETPGQALTVTIVARLREHRMLLILDNCEHVITACAEMVEELLESCPEVRILATSREPLAIACERVWKVPPLSVPEMGEAAPEVLDGCEAVGLFVERAAAVQPGFVLNAHVAPAVAEICRRLDGIPLAIELAAARVETLTPAEITRRLDDRFGLLSRGSAGVLPRHQTLEAALDWSHELLSAPERTLLRRLSVFVGGFDLAAVKAECAHGESEPVSSLLAQLVAKSLVVADAAHASPARYRLLETIRAYAAERLEEAGEAALFREAHAHFYRDLAERAEPELTGPDQQRWFERLERERENLRLALEWSLGHGQSESALRLAGALVLFWRVRCHFSEGPSLSSSL